MWQQSTPQNLLILFYHQAPIEGHIKQAKVSDCDTVYLFPGNRKSGDINNVWWFKFNTYK